MAVYVSVCEFVRVAVQLTVGDAVGTNETVTLGVIVGEALNACDELPVMA